MSGKLNPLMDQKVVEALNLFLFFVFVLSLSLSVILNILCHFLSVSL